MSVLQDMERDVAFVRRLRSAGQALAQSAQMQTPPANLGVFGAGEYSAWEAGKAYAAGEVFSYDGQVGFVKQAHTSGSTWIPFAAGTEALYGARPVPDADGVYPYVYNMAASVGMRVRGADGAVYVCTQAIPDMLWPPEQILAHFEVEG